MSAVYSSPVEPTFISDVAELNRRCEDFHSKCQSLIAQMDGSTEGQHILLRLFINYSDKQVQRVALWAESESDLLAYATRNLLEWSLWCRYIESSPLGISVLEHEAEADLTDIFRGNPVLGPSADLSIFPELGDELSPSLIAARDATAKILELFEDEDGRSRRRYELHLQRDRLETFVFKLCSKLMHPSSVSMLLSTGEPQSVEQRKRLWAVSLFYAESGLSLLSIPPSQEAQS